MARARLERPERGHALGLEAIGEIDDRGGERLDVRASGAQRLARGDEPAARVEPIGQRIEERFRAIGEGIAKRSPDAREEAIAMALGADAAGEGDFAAPEIEGRAPFEARGLREIALGAIEQFDEDRDARGGRGIVRDDRLRANEAGARIGERVGDAGEIAVGVLGGFGGVEGSPQVGKDARIRDRERRAAALQFSPTLITSSYSVPPVPFSFLFSRISFTSPMVFAFSLRASA